MRPVEVVNVRTRVVGITPRIDWPRHRLGKADSRGAIAARRRVYFGGKHYDAPIYAREKLRAGNRLRGPAIVSEYSATTVVPPDWGTRVDGFENLVLVDEPEQGFNAECTENAGEHREDRDTHAGLVNSGDYGSI